VAVLSILGFWAFYYALTSARAAIIGAEHQLIMAERRAAVTLASIVLTLLLWRMLRRAENRSLWVMVAAGVIASIPVSIAYAGINHLAFYVYDPIPAVVKELEEYAAKISSPTQVRMMMIGYQAAEWFYFIVVWAMLYVALSYAARVGHAERAAAVYRAEAQTAHLRALRYQINPHFLFNTLNSLSTLVLRGRADEADLMILNLSTFFRTSLTTDPESDVTLSDEVRMQQLYLDIERIRFPDRLATVFDVPEDLWQAAVPSMILQPVVENAIKHCVAASTAKVTIAIRSRAEAGLLHISVEDDAVGGTPQQPGASTGVGLGNVRERLAARFGKAACLRHGPRAGGGFRVDITMPLIKTAFRRDARPKTA
jgi:hypothetical protein